MSVFSDNIKNATDLQSFYDYWKKYIEDRFEEIYNYMNGDLNRISSMYNGIILNSTIRGEFANHEIYQPWLHCQFVNGEDYHSIIQIAIFYSDDPLIYAGSDAKVFLLINIPIPKQL